MKDEYRAATEAETANETEVQLYSFFRFGAFTHVAIHLCAETLLEVFGGGVSTKKSMILDDELSVDQSKAIEQLPKVVKFTLAPIPPFLSGKDAYAHFRSVELIRELASHIQTTVNQLRAMDTSSVDPLKVGITAI